MKKNIFALGLGAVAAFATSAAHAAGTAAIETGFATVATDLQTLLGGAGGVLLTVVAVIFGIVMLVIGRGWAPLAMAVGASFVIGQGMNIATGISGATATTAALSAAGLL